MKFETIARVREAGYHCGGPGAEDRGCYVAVEITAPNGIEVIHTDLMLNQELARTLHVGDVLKITVRKI